MMERLRTGQHGGQLILEGLRGVGKTALMAQVRQTAGNQGVTTVAAEIGEGKERDIASRIADTIRDVTPSSRLGEIASRLRTLKVGPVSGELVPREPDHVPSLSELVADLAHVAKANDHPVLLTFDEAHEAPETAAAIVRGFHEAAQDNAPLGGFYAGLPGTHAKLAEITTYAERLPVTTLGMLDADNVRTALVQPCRDRDVDVDPRVVDAVMDATGGYPYFVQVWGSELWNATTDPDLIGTDAYLDAAPRVAETTSRLFSSRYSRLAGTQQAYVDALGTLGGHATSGNVAEAMDRPVTAVSGTRGELIDRGICFSPAYGEVAFTIPGFSDWLDGRQRETSQSINFPTTPTPSPAATLPPDRPGSHHAQTPKPRRNR